MAVIQVSSMQEFISALQGVSSYTTIEVMSNLDFNDVVNQITDQTLNFPSDYTDLTSDITINGNGHAIINVEGAGFNPTVFRFMNCQNVVINDLSFLNCHITKSTTALITANTTSVNTITINNSVIQGKFYGYPFGSCTLNDCMITFSQCQGIMSNQYCNFNRCWIKFDKCTAKAKTTGIIYNCNQCYFTGVVGYTDMLTSTKVMGSLNNCCVNVTFNLVNSDVMTTQQIFGAVQDMLTVINKEKIQLAIHSELEDTTYLKLVTDEQMKNAEYLADIGFDIIP